MPVYLADAFSLNMLGLVPGEAEHLLIGALTEERFVADLKDPLDGYSLVGHKAIATFLTQILGREVPCNPNCVEARLEPGDRLYVVSIEGGPPEGGEPELDWVRNAAKAFFWVAIPPELPSLIVAFPRNKEFMY